MIGYLNGKIIDKKPTKILLDVNGVGYIINISLNTFDKLPDEGAQVSVFTYLSVREDAMDLYGFILPEEKEMFLLLIGVNGIGAKLAQNILSGINTSELKESLKTGNLARLTAVPGVGRKTAERMIVELRDKVESLAGDTVTSFQGAVSNVKTDSLSALSSLGYNVKVAEKAVNQILSANPSVSIEDLIRLSLGILNK
ncbi:MAG: Holliday junction branch migration protein RuvA [Ignavibacteria bacterium]|nr:Holliday junction branch migration protein RuvA [Ignavibacteria bacterium]